MSRRASIFIHESPAKASDLESTRPSAQHVTTGMHPVVFQIGLSAAVWLVAVSWLYFAWGRHVDLDLAVATGFFIMFFTLFLVAAAGIINDPRWSQQRVTFRTFLGSDVPTYTGEMRGRDALIEITLIPVSLAFAATIIGLAWLYLR